MAGGRVPLSGRASELAEPAPQQRRAPDARQVQLKDQIPCGFTLDNDVTGSTDGAVLHLKGTLTIIGTSFNC
jgi:hypothetical protein